MDDTDELCYIEGPGGTYCMKPKNHDGNTHEFEVLLPSDIAQIVDNLIAVYEDMNARLAREIRWARIGRWSLCAAVLLNLMAVVINPTSP